MTSEEILFDAEERMEKAVSVFRDELRGLRTGRATPALVDMIRVEYYGSLTPLKQMAQISTPDPQQILIKPYDQSCLKDVEKAIRASDLGMSPNSDGKMIRLIVPPMSGEQRQKMVARIKKSAEEAKVACRNIRRDANKHFDQAEKEDYQVLAPQEAPRFYREEKGGRQALAFQAQRVERHGSQVEQHDRGRDVQDVAGARAKTR